jgi:hypothetical protein
MKSTVTHPQTRVETGTSGDALAQTLSHGVWVRWSYRRPPQGVVVEGAFGDDPMNPRYVDKGTVCRRGCCFDAIVGGGDVPPEWWRSIGSTDGSWAAR